MFKSCGGSVLGGKKRGLPDLLVLTSRRSLIGDPFSGSDVQFRWLCSGSRGPVNGSKRALEEAVSHEGGSSCCLGAWIKYNIIRLPGGIFPNVLGKFRQSM